MSVVDDLLQPSSDSFWEIGKYMRTVKRCDNGNKLCDQLRRLIEERNRIEKSYASSLSTWAKSWHEFLDKGPEYGTGLAAWRGILAEAEQTSDLHLAIADSLVADVHASIKAWQKKNYHKSLMHFKETKDFEDGFKKAQKPWSKRLSKVLTAKKEYHTACRSEKSLSNQESNAQGDQSLSDDNLKKVREKLKKCRNEVESSCNVYHASLSDLNGYNAKYIEDVTEIYDNCQNFENERITFFKTIFFDVHKCLDISINPKFTAVYTDLHRTISSTDASQDLKYWSNTYGVNMAMAWPQFEEYSPELQAITKRFGRGSANTGDGGITITSIRHSQDSNMAAHYPTDQSPSCFGQRLEGIADDENQSEQCSDDDEKEDATAPADEHQSSGTNGMNPFAGFFTGADDKEEGGVVDDASQGRAVRALYNYEQAEDDEIGFQAGDVFVQVGDEDEMGWCKGRKDGNVGFFPKHYVEEI